MENILDDEFSFDVDRWKNLLNKQIRVECLDGRIFEGRFYTIDPKSLCLVLLNEEKNELDVIFRNDLIKIEVLSNSISPLVQPDEFDGRSLTTDGDDSTIDRYEKLRFYLKSKRIPFEENLVERRISIHNGIVQMDFPFKFENLLGKNEIVIRKLQHLLKEFLQ